MKTCLIEIHCCTRYVDPCGSKMFVKQGIKRKQWLW